MNVEIYYFSGTGNTLFVAKELRKRIPGAGLTPMVSLLRSDTIQVKAATVGFVFPLHGMTLPVPVEAFLRRINLQSAKYIFAIATRGGTTCKAFKRMEKLLLKKNKRLDSYFIINMPNNDPKFEVYDIPTQETMNQIESHLQDRLDSIQGIVRNQQQNREQDLTGESFTHSRPVNFVMEQLVLLGMAMVKNFGVKNYFYSDSKCTGCGICETVCLSQKICMIDKRPVWQKSVNCYFCYTCLNYCPEESIQIKSKPYMKSFTKYNARYPHPYATAKEIAGQKLMPE